ncbi:hypothetical protein ACIQI7_32020 [Kitasatospora sp. NPDC092039]|uniref:hypothetical protein n=1 Tax=Kitasatospora sp. NPDC092039 TaxID=3364086 RepID=UPI00381574A6
MTFPHPAPAGPTEPGTAALVHGAVIINTVETAWQEIRRRHPDVPHLSVTTAGGDGADPTRCATLRTGREFTRDGALTMELQFSPAALRHGGRANLQALLHHAAHGVARRRGVKEVSSGYRWHNKHFARIARDLGLTPPRRATPVVGMADCRLSDAEASRWDEVIALLDAAAGAQLEALVQSTAAPRSPRSGSRFAVVCAECSPPRRLQITPFAFDQGPLLCGVCLTKFRPAPPTG